MGFIEDRERELREERDTWVTAMVDRLKTARVQILQAQSDGDKLTTVKFGQLEIGVIDGIYSDLMEWFHEEPSPNGPILLSMSVDMVMGQDTITAHF